MVDVVQSDNPDHNEVDSDDVAQQLWSNQNQDSGNESGDRSNMGGGEIHDDLLRMTDWALDFEMVLTRGIAVADREE
jgi:hypothetical protein